MSAPAGSALYRGVVRHARLEPFEHRFAYRVYYGLFDIGDLDDLGRRHRLFSYGRFNLFSLDPEDHGAGDGPSLRPWAEDLLADAGVDLEGGTILLLAMPRILGFVFNPISEWYVYGPDGTLRAVIHEVRNTFGDKHAYVVPVEPGRPIRHAATKAMHVSPFVDMEATYEFTMTEPGKRLSLLIDEHTAEGHLLRASLVATRLPFSDGNLLRLFVTHPLVTLKVLGAIHWQALLLWRKGAPFRRRPQPPSRTVSLVRPTEDAAA